MVLWSSAIFCLLLVFAWIAEFRYGVYLMSPGGYFVGTGEGLVGLGVVDPVAGKVGLNIERHETHLWWFEWEFESGRKVFAAPIWLLLLCAAIVGGTAYWKARQAWQAARVGLCQKCGYERAGLALTTKCPECGEVGGGTSQHERPVTG